MLSRNRAVAASLAAVAICLAPLTPPPASAAAQKLPSQELPSQELPSQQVPSQELPSQEVPSQEPPPQLPPQELPSTPPLAAAGEPGNTAETDAPEAPEESPEPEEPGGAGEPGAPEDQETPSGPEDPVSPEEPEGPPWPTGLPGGDGLPGTRIPVWPGLTRHEVTIRLGDGRPAVVNIFDFDPSQGSVQLRPELGQGGLRGLETVQGTVQRLMPEGAVAGVNGGFWLNNPVGDPNGYFAQQGALLSEPQTQGAGPRAVYARRSDGSFLIDRLDARLRLSATDNGLEIGIRGLNRSPSQVPPYADGDSSAFMYTPLWGPSVDAQPVEAGSTALRTLVIEGLKVPAGNAMTEGIVSRVIADAGDVPIPQDGAVVVTMGGAAGLIEDSGIASGDRVSFELSLTPSGSDPTAWTDLVDGVAAGPLLVKDRAVVDPASWSDEGFSPGSHSNSRAPRSAMGITADGHVLLLTVDGRQPGYSHGMTMAELAAYMLHLGAVDAMSLDGGASSQFVAEGRLLNRPCCDRALRPVADSLVLFRDPYGFAATRRLAGGGREATAAAIAAAMFPDGNEEVLLASAGSFPDALAGGPLAAAEDAALLLTGKSELSVTTRSALEQLDPRRVTILGGTAAIGGEVEEELEELGVQVRRLAGLDRTETAAAVAASLGSEHQRVFLAAADGFADALAAAAPAGMLGAPILLTDPELLSEATRAALLYADTEKVVVVGGSAAIATAVEQEVEDMGIAVTRLAGVSRYGTAAAVNRWAHEEVPDLDPSGLVVAFGGTFPDALAGGPLAASLRQLLMLVPPYDVEADPDAAAYLQELAAADLAEVTLLGGTAVLTDYQRWQLDQMARPEPPESPSPPEPDAGDGDGDDDDEHSGDSP